ncbi:predicted protein [Uncinocarpus reesii 1704]|uniref:Ferric oxidoreductase domain-containing protein n=1 Tax=Uncinocarpus reesii (strain UAMH 1704) TaxID=336963 RepID=C4JK73_UNCRE|nr:uncharacterized protein UREG_02030 [Uncinocarpus reesii 1704]EEP77181.1 predicted protein [Uncinocarpus reesii 1704]
MSISRGPYRFLSLSAAQVQARRELLDLRGTIAQISALLLLLAASLYWRAVSAHSPAAGGKKTGKNWFDSPPVKGWRETRRQYLLTLAWGVWLVGLSAWRTDDDYLHLTKSLAHTAMATIPIQVLFAPKLASRSNFVLRLLGVRQAIFTPYHRLYGRLVLFPLLTLHAILYITFFMRQSLLAKRSSDADVQWGMAGIILAWAIWSMSSGGKTLTKRQFYLGHVAMVMGLLVVAYFHVVHVRRLPESSTGFNGWVNGS